MILIGCAGARAAVACSSIRNATESSELQAAKPARSGSGLSLGRRWIAMPVRILLLALVTFGAVPAIAQQLAVDEIVVEGNQRLDADTVRSHMTIEAGTEVSPLEVNASLQALFATGLFEDVSIEPQGRTLVVRVVERPFVSVVSFEGNAATATELLEPIIRTKPRTVFSPAVVEEDARRIVEAYGRSGRLSATVVPQVIEREGNRVDIVFEIDEGLISRIRKVAFLGNRVFPDSTLRDVIESRESAWYRLLTGTDNFDPGRLEIDKQALERYYTGRGYADFKVDSTVASLNESGSGFVLTFTLTEGPRYRIGDVSVASRTPGLSAEALRELVLVNPGEWYDSLLVDNSAEDMLDSIEEQGAFFLDVEPEITRRDDERIVDIVFRVVDTEGVYVERIEIIGNVRTHDSVIRREFSFVEGDALNRTRLAETRRNIRALGFFSQVDVRVEPGSRSDRVMIVVEVEERSTGSLSLGAGYSSTSALVFNISLSENNLLGRGQRLRFDFSDSQSGTTYDIAFVEPYFLERNLEAGFNLYRDTASSGTSALYELSRTGFVPHAEFPLAADTRLRVNYTYEAREREGDITQFSPLLPSQDGLGVRSSLGYRLLWDRRDDAIQPRSGWVISLEQDLAGIGGDTKYLSAESTGRLFVPLDREETITGILTGRLGAIRSFDDYDLDAVDRFYLGGGRLRGFSFRGVGPRDPETDESLGGTLYAAASAELISSFLFPEELGLQVGFFVDAGTVFDLERTSYTLATGEPVVVDDDAKLRAGTGGALYWFSPIGPIQFVFARAIKKEPEDVTESFRFTIGTPF